MPVLGRGRFFRLRRASAVLLREGRERRASGQRERCYPPVLVEGKLARAHLGADVREVAPHLGGGVVHHGRHVQEPGVPRRHARALHRPRRVPSRVILRLKRRHRCRLRRVDSPSLDATGSRLG
eukprot:433587-Prorocentrum_minimum.AAC.1